MSLGHFLALMMQAIENDMIDIFNLFAVGVFTKF